MEPADLGRFHPLASGVDLLLGVRGMAGVALDRVLERIIAGSFRGLAKSCRARGEAENERENDRETGSLLLKDLADDQKNHKREKGDAEDEEDYQ